MIYARGTVVRPERPQCEAKQIGGISHTGSYLTVNGRLVAHISLDPRIRGILRSRMFTA